MGYFPLKRSLTGILAKSGMVVISLLLLLSSCSSPSSASSNTPVIPGSTRVAPSDTPATPSKTLIVPSFTPAASGTFPVLPSFTPATSGDTSDVQGYTPPGRIAFLSSEEIPSGSLDLILSDGSGDTLRYVGFFTGSPAFSPDGSLIAIGCPPPYDSEEKLSSKICILDIKKFISAREEIPLGQRMGYDARYAIASKLALPEQCQGYRYSRYSQSDGPIGIYSISWSPNADKIVVVCGDLKYQHACVLSLTGESSCWDHAVGENIFRAVWSPVDENVIAISGQRYPTSKIYLVDSGGNNPKYIVDGMNPEWSPDGKRIAYVEEILSPDGRSSQGIASVNEDGSNHQWLYKPDPTDRNSYINLYAWDSGWPSRLSWSPDGRFIVFSAIRNYWYTYRIFRLDLSTGKVITLVDPGIFSDVVVEADWGP